MLNRFFLEPVADYFVRAAEHRRSRVLASSFGAFGEGSTLEGGIRVKNPENLFIGERVLICQGVILRPRKNHIRIGDDSGVNPYVVIYGKVVIGKYALVGPHVTIMGGNHSIEDVNIPMSKSGKGTNLGVVVEDDVWLGSHALVLDGVTIGTGAVVGAGTVVSSNVDPYDIVVGSSMRRIGNRRERANTEHENSR